MATTIIALIRKFVTTTLTIMKVTATKITKLGATGGPIFIKYGTMNPLEPQHKKIGVITTIISKEAF